MCCEGSSWSKVSLQGRRLARRAGPPASAGHAQPRRLIKDFEREARTDGLPAGDLAARKRLLVAELNGLITAKKKAAGELDARRELVADGRVNKAGAEIAPSGAGSRVGQLEFLLIRLTAAQHGCAGSAQLPPRACKAQGMRCQCLHTGPLTSTSRTAGACLLLNTTAQSVSVHGTAGMTTVALMAQGRKDIKETDASLARAERVVADTIAVGTATAATLAAQVRASRRWSRLHQFQRFSGHTHPSPPGPAPRERIRQHLHSRHAHVHACLMASTTAAMSLL